MLVSSHADWLIDGHAELWDSGRVESDRTLVEYAGKALTSTQGSYWKVAVWTNGDESETWSDVAQFEMGLLKASDWVAKWIESPDPSCRSPIFRYDVVRVKAEKHVRAYLCGLGYAELYINGNRVGDRVLDPAQTDYETRCLYVGYDVTDLLKVGPNVIAVMLGNGFYTQYRVWGGMSYGRPKMIFQLHVDEGAIVVSDKTWKTIAGPVIENNVYAGETYDARKEIAGWNSVDGDAKNWAAAEEAAWPTKSLQPHLMPPLRRTRTIEPTKISNVGNVHIVDLGENFAGWTKLTVQNGPGKPIRLRSAEELHSDGTLDTASTGVFATNVEQIDTYIPKGTASETWEPRFTYHGFRYVEISGLRTEPTGDTLKGVAVHTDLEPIGTFECSDPTINRIYATAIRTLTSNIHSIPTDCPAREKCGWLGDAHIASEFALCAFDAAPLYDKYLHDIETTWIGELPGDVAPGKRCSNPGGHLDWGLALIFLPWHVYLYRGDETILQDHYAAMRRFMQTAMKQAKDGIISSGYGDWCPPGSVEPTATPPALTTTALFVHAARIMTRVAWQLQHPDDAAGFTAFATTSADAFNRKFFQPDKNSYGSQCADAMALELDLVSAANRSAVAAALNADVMQTHGAHHTTGIFGTRYLYPALAGNALARRRWRCFARQPIQASAIYSRAARPPSGNAGAKRTWTPNGARDLTTMSCRPRLSHGFITDWAGSCLRRMRRDLNMLFYVHSLSSMTS